MTPVVIDASAGVELVADTVRGRALRGLLPPDAVPWVPEFFYVECGAVLRRWDLNAILSTAQITTALEQLMAWPLRVTQVRGLIFDAWGLRANLTFADAVYVALAEHLGADLLTDDHKLAGAPNFAGKSAAPSTSSLKSLRRRAQALSVWRRDLRQRCSLADPRPSRPGNEGSTDDHDDERRPRRGHRPGPLCGGRIPGRLPGKHPAQLRHRPAPVRRLVRGGQAGAVRSSSGPPGAVRPVDGGDRQDALHGGAAAVHLGQLLPPLRAEGLVERNSAANVRRPKVDYESRTLGLDRNELGAFLVQAGLGSARDHALASLLALNGLRISEALGADIEDLEFERGHRTLKIVRKGGKAAVIPLAPRTSRALDLYIDERTTGPVFLGAKGERMDRYAADRRSSAWHDAPGSPNASALTACGTASSPPPSTPAYPCEMSRRRPVTPIPAPPCATTGAGVPWTVTPPTSCRRSWPTPLAESFSWCGRYRAIGNARTRRLPRGHIADGWLKELPVAELIRRGLVTKRAQPVEQLREVLNFFGVANRGAFEALWNEAVAFRQSLAYEADPGSVAAWLRIGELEAEAISCQPFDRRRFAQALQEARKLTLIRHAGVFLSKLQGLCAAAGVAVVVVEETPRARVFGAARWLSPEKGLIQLSFRYKSNDVFWFTFFHEGRHILQETKRQTILEGKDTQADDAERDADQFAADLLIPPAYRRRLHDVDTLADARALAEELEVAPGIVVGRLHFLELKPYSWGANLKWRYEFSAHG